MLIIIIMVIFKCYFCRVHIALSHRKLCEHGIRKNKQCNATFSSFQKVSQLTVKKCIHNSAPNSCELDPIPSKLLIECLDSILPSLTDLFSSSLASGIFSQCFESALVTPI